MYIPHKFGTLTCKSDMELLLELQLQVELDLLSLAFGSPFHLCLFRLQSQQTSTETLTCQLFI